MCPRKLSESDKLEILELYRCSPETTSTLAERYEVSNSTISRVLKKNLSHQEYEDLIQDKRLGRGQKSSAQLVLTLAQESSAPLPTDQLTPEEQETNSGSPRRRKRRSSRQEEQFLAQDFPDNSPPSSDLLGQEIAHTEQNQSINVSFGNNEDLPVVSPLTPESVLALEEFLGEDLDDEDLDDEDLDDEDLDDEDLDDEDLDDISDTRIINLPSLKQGNLEISPLENAHFPKTCYIVVDRSSELITRPLQEFRELGLIPPEEFAQKTLPIFENHRVARRFSKRKERVIKIPDGGLLKKTSSYLADKGITRLILDGQVYSVSF